MLNKRVRTFLTLVLAGAMVLSEPAASWAADKSAQSESKKEDSEDSEKEEQADSKKEEKSKDKKKKTSSNSVSSDDTSSSNVTFERVLAKAKAAAPDSDDLEDEAEEKKEEEAESQEEETKNASKKADEELEENEVLKEDEALEEKEESGEDETSEELKAHYENKFEIKGGTEGTDYRYDQATGVLTVSTNKPLTASGTVSEGSLSVNSTQGASLSLNGLHITTSVNSSAVNVTSSTGEVEIHLGGKRDNELNGKTSGINVENSGKVTIDGSGILTGKKIDGKVKVAGGNIRVPIDTPVDISGNQLDKVSVNGLSTNNLYQVSGNSLTSYAEGIYSGEYKDAVLYLPKLPKEYKYDVKPEGNVLKVEVKENKEPVPSGTPSPSLTPSPTPDASPVPDLASETANGLYWIDNGTTYRSGANLQFYATGDGYGPDEPQETTKIAGSTRYIPIDWNVSTTSSYVSGNSSSVGGKWKKSDREVTKGQMAGSVYTEGEYRFKGSFTLNTTGTSSVPYTLKVNYKRQTYGEDGWEDDGTTAAQSRSFYIRNTTATTTVRPTTTPYVRSTVTTSATRSGISTNARNASTGDETPIGTLVMLLAAAAVSGTAIFRKKRIGKQ